MSLCAETCRDTSVCEYGSQRLAAEQELPGHPSWNPRALWPLLCRCRAARGSTWSPQCLWGTVGNNDWLRCRKCLGCGDALALAQPLGAAGFAPGGLGWNWPRRVGEAQSAQGPRQPNLVSDAGSATYLVVWGREAWSRLYCPEGRAIVMVGRVIFALHLLLSLALAWPAWPPTRVSGRDLWVLSTMCPRVASRTGQGPP